MYENLLLKVELPNTDGISFTTFTFDILLHQENENVIFMTLGPVPVSATCQKCVFLEFDPKPDDDDDLGHIAIIQLFCFNEKCTKKGTQPLEPKNGSRSMLLGAMYALLHLAHKEKRWPHLTKFVLNDESDYKCKLTPSGPEYIINTFATDLLTQDKTYYQRHLNANLSAIRARKALMTVRAKITSQVSLSGSEFFKELKRLTTIGYKPNAEQTTWINSNISSLIKIFDDAKNAGESWETAFKVVQHRFSCKMYACFYEQLIVFFNLHYLKGASYEVGVKDLPGYGKVKTRFNKNSIHVLLSGGGRSNIYPLYYKLYAKMYRPKKH